MSIKHLIDEGGGVFSLQVVSSGVFPHTWLREYRERGGVCTNGADTFLHFGLPYNPTDMIASEMVIIRSECYSEEERITHKIHEDARRRRLFAPSVEHACLLRDALTRENMERIGLRRVIVMHMPPYAPSPDLLCIDGDDVLALVSGGVFQPYGTRCGLGFAFVRSMRPIPVEDVRIHASFTSTPPRSPLTIVSPLPSTRLPTPRPIE